MVKVSGYLMRGWGLGEWVERISSDVRMVREGWRVWWWASVCEGGGVLHLLVRMNVKGWER
jgi:hypothetical protein